MNGYTQDEIDEDIRNATVSYRRKIKLLDAEMKSLRDAMVEARKRVRLQLHPDHNTNRCGCIYCSLMQFMDTALAGKDGDR